ncbi:hypothetical protein BCR41DRAFT_191675 [Lobosporangium transversale]|uniref:Uncharacterized protein n=1 Tax=Lobosporangium transversale TaxID=64571 RepID=A0A1Y2G9G8_9FUNG|nr:hypothetical protein BCR41DRAFT_191675 [Lobosporangium transversale]ORZ04812.1 hypothetical protein BCR41DRAFT_191675 [Lobosporangium transversale]|eukprot:XP_021876749.1 hypothetical protein BCR41DRAFT_191675 [Lobosporangium transversale]
MAIPGGASKESCLALGRILTTNSTLIMLDVSGNFEKRRSGAQEDKPISASGSTTAPPDYHSVGGFGPHIALSFPALAKNSKLRVLSIDHNRFGEESLVELCEALRRNTTLGIFSCDGNDAFTPTGLETIAEIFAPPRVDAVAVKAVATPENGALSLTLSPAYNQSLSIWDLKAEEILTQMELLAREVQRHTAEQYGIEKLQAGKDVKFMGLTPLEDVKRQLQNAERNRIRYVETHARIIEAIKANNKQGKGAKNMS